MICLPARKLTALLKPVGRCVYNVEPGKLVNQPVFEWTTDPSSQRHLEAEIQVAAICFRGIVSKLGMSH